MKLKLKKRRTIIIVFFLTLGITLSLDGQEQTIPVTKKEVNIVVDSISKLITKLRALDSGIQNRSKYFEQIVLCSVYLDTEI